ncbi:MAG: Multifunctional alkaline phosphatase superfamily protein [Phycisphaerae bacterium]|nr:Multifunctional alkaline phosphatase superfamily protein [Phycisphaerae bacterium]
MKRPNILLIYSDQHRGDCLGSAGHPDVQTPHLDRLAAGGTRYDRCICQNPVCMPSRVSMLSGLYPSTLRITHMGVPVPQDLPTLPKMLGNYGYHSANIGKLHFLPHANRDHREVHPAYGFDHAEISDEPGCYEDNYRAWVRARVPEALDHISPGLPPQTEAWQKAMRIKDGIVHPEVRHEPKPVVFKPGTDLTHSAFVAEQTIEYLRAHRDGPFFCIAGFYSPHSPWVVSQPFLDRYDPAAFALPKFPPGVDARRGPGLCDDAELRSARHGYYGMITELDHHVGRLLDELDTLGVADETIVVYTSDHGEFLGEHLAYGKGYPAPDCISRVPMIVRRPGGAAGATCTGLVESVDLAPSLLNWAAIPVPPHLQGSPLPAAGAPGKPAALTEHHGWKALRTGRYRYIARADGGETLIDVQADPGEYNDLSADPGRAADLSECRRAMVNKLVEIERPIPRVWPY